MCNTDRLKQGLEERYFGLERTLDHVLNHRRTHLDHLRERLHQEAPHLRVERAAHRLNRLSDHLARYHPVSSYAERQATLANTLDLHIDHQLDHAQLALARLVEQLDILSPLKTLARGYSLVRHAKGSTIDSASQVKVGDRIMITLREGEVVAEVSEVRVPTQLESSATTQIGTEDVT